MMLNGVNGLLPRAPMRMDHVIQTEMNLNFVHQTLVLSR